MVSNFDASSMEGVRRAPQMLPSHYRLHEEVQVGVVCTPYR